jgi:hypothetical protein
LPYFGGVVAATRFDQSSALTTWVINHNLNRDVISRVFSVGGVELACEIAKITANQIEVRHDVATSGYVLVI